MDKSQSITTQRNFSFDLMRICACFMVVMLHVAASSWYSLTPDNFDWQVMNFYDSLTRCAVPVFFMLSGAYILKKEVKFKNLYLKKIIPLIIIYFIWSFMYAIDKIGLDKIGTIGINEIIRITVNSHYHLWFIPTLIGVYIIQPLLHSIVSYEHGKYIRYFIILFCIFEVINPTIQLFISNSTVNTLLKKIPVELMGYSGYMIIGYFYANVCDRQFKPLHMLIGFIIVVIISTIICQLDALAKGKPTGILYGYFSLASFLEAQFLFLFFKNIKINYSKRVRETIYKTSLLTFGSYLLHPFILTQLFSKFHFSTISFNTVVSIPVITIITVLICFVVTSIMIKIPIISKLWKL